MRRRRKTNKIYALILILLVVSLGFATLSTTLKINGTAGIKSSQWDIHWENVQPNASSTVTIPYSFASGSSVSNEMYVIIPATPAIKIPTKTCGKNNPKINIPTNAPIGSVIPDSAA